MKNKIAIQTDYFKTNQEIQSFSSRWKELLDKSSCYQPRIIDVYSDSIVDDIKGCSAFMWRPIGLDAVNAARRIIPSLQASIDIPFFPEPLATQFTRDKIAQYYRLIAEGLPIPKTRVCYSLDDATSYLETARFPLVVKLASGRGSESVALLSNIQDALLCAKCLFHNGVNGLWQAIGTSKRIRLRQFYEVWKLLRGEPVCNNREFGPLIFQEFLPNNEFDTRVTIIGRHATAFRRMNRENDFRASGSGLPDYDTYKIDPRAIEIAFNASRCLKTPFLALDFLYRKKQPVICELNFSYLAWAVRRCPGHWFLDDEQSTDNIQWRGTPIEPEAITLKEFLRISGMPEY